MRGLPLRFREYLIPFQRSYVLPAQMSWAWSKIGGGGSRWNFVSMWLRTGDMGGGNFSPLGHSKV